VKQGEGGPPSLINHVLRDLPLDQPLPAAGANVWLTAVPSEEMHTTLSRHEWLALLRLRYGQVPKDVVSVCVCGESNTLIHPLVCPHGGHQIRRHDRLRDLLAGFVQAISPVSVEPTLHPLEAGESFPLRSTNTQPGARADILIMEGFYTPYRMLLADVKVLTREGVNPSSLSLFKALEVEEHRKSIEYEARVRTVENADFIPLVFTESGLLGYKTRNFIHELSLRLASKSKQSLSSVRSCIMAELSFFMSKHLLAHYFAPRGKVAVPFGLKWVFSPYAAILSGLDRRIPS